MDIQVKRWHPGSGSAHSGGADSWGDPEPFQIMGWSPSMSSEAPVMNGANRITSRRTIYAWQALSHKDILVMDGEEWQVTQDVSDWGQGPYGWTPGIVFTVEQNRG